MALSAPCPCSDAQSIGCDMIGRVNADVSAKSGDVDAPEHSSIDEIESNDSLYLGRDMDRVVVRKGADQQKRETRTFRSRHRLWVMDDGPFDEDLQNSCLQSATRAQKAHGAMPGTTTQSGDLASDPFSPFNQNSAVSRAASSLSEEAKP